MRIRKMILTAVLLLMVGAAAYGLGRAAGMQAASGNMEGSGVPSHETAAAVSEAESAEETETAESIHAAGEETGQNTQEPGTQHPTGEEAVVLTSEEQTSAVNETSAGQTKEETSAVIAASAEQTEEETSADTETSAGQTKEETSAVTAASAEQTEEETSEVEESLSQAAEDIYPVYIKNAWLDITPTQFVPFEISHYHIEVVMSDGSTVTDPEGFVAFPQEFHQMLSWVSVTYKGLSYQFEVYAKPDFGE